MAIGLAPIFVKFLMMSGGVGPVAAGFWRMSIGSLFFAATLFFSPDRSTTVSDIRKISVANLLPLVAAGVLFALDLSVWHTSFAYTSVASSTLIANLSSILVPLSGVVFFKERLKPKLIIGGAIAIVGVIGLTLFKVSGSRDSSQDSLILGEGLAFLTAFFYTGYMLVIKKMSGKFPSRLIMLVSTAISAAVLLVFALFHEGRLFPEVLSAWVWILAVGTISQGIGQGLIAKALSTLPVSQSALILLCAPTSSAVFGWLILGESLASAQIVSGRDSDARGAATNN